LRPDLCFLDGFVSADGGTAAPVGPPPGPAVTALDFPRMKHDMAASIRDHSDPVLKISKKAV
jgi:hypothetical protein